MIDRKRRRFEASNFYSMGVSQIRRESLEKAEASFRKAVELDPELAMAWAYLSVIYQRRGMLEEAEDAREMALNLEGGIDFDAIEKDCRRFEDRQSIIRTLHKYQSDDMNVNQLMMFILSLSPRAIALVANHSSSQRFFRSIIEHVAIAKMSKMEFEDLPWFLSRIDMEHDEVVRGLSLYAVAGVLSENGMAGLQALISFLKDRTGSRKASEQVQLWDDIVQLVAEHTSSEASKAARGAALLRAVDELGSSAHMCDEEQLSLIRTNTIFSIVSDESLRTEEQAMSLVESLGERYEELPDSLAPAILAVLVRDEKRKRTIEFFSHMRRALVSLKAPKESMKRAEEWGEVFERIRRKIELSVNQYDQLADLLDVIEETDGKFEPVAIAEQALLMIRSDVARESRADGLFIYEPMNLRRPIIGESKYHVMRWLSAIERAYTKLLSMASNEELEISPEGRERMGEVAEEMLEFLVFSRLDDLMVRTGDRALWGLGIMDLFFPSEYLSFPLPAFRALNRVFKDPYPFAASFETRNPGFRLVVSKWILAAAVSLTVLPRKLLDVRNVDLTVHEYLKTFSLAMKKSEYEFRIFLEKADVGVTPRAILMFTVKNLLSEDAVGLGRKEVEDAFDFGGWDDDDLRNMVLDESRYCIYCYSKMKDGRSTCPECGKKTLYVDFFDKTYEDIYI